MIGDPSGRSTERDLLDPDAIQHNLEFFSAQFRNIEENIMTELKMDKSDDNKSPLKTMYVNNMRFYHDLDSIGFLRDIGKHFRVSTMLGRDSVKSRMTTTTPPPQTSQKNSKSEGISESLEGESESQSKRLNSSSSSVAEGISFTEFAYQILQANDFYNLYMKHGCKVQLGGSDQWGNIASGCDFVRKKTGCEAFGVTIPLLVNSKGEKFGKSTGGGALWLDQNKTAPFDLYQYLRNVQDSEVENLLFQLTFLDKDLIENTMRAHNEAPEKRRAQQMLAEEVTKIVHGRGALLQVQQSTDAFFNLTDCKVGSLSFVDFQKAFALTEVVHIGDSLDKMTISSLIAKSGLRKTRADAKRVIQQGGVTINGSQKLKDELLTEDDVIQGNHAIVRVGKKKFALVQFECLK